MSIQTIFQKYWQFFNFSLMQKGTYMSLLRPDLTIALSFSILARIYFKVLVLTLKKHYMGWCIFVISLIHILHHGLSVLLTLSFHLPSCEFHCKKIWGKNLFLQRLSYKVMECSSLHYQECSSGTFKIVKSHLSKVVFN